MNLKELSDQELHSQTELSVARERQATATLLLHLCEIDRRRLFAKYGCNSLFDYCVRALKMSEPQAARRVNATRVFAECPEVESMIESGSLSLTAISQAQTFFRQEAHTGNRLSRESKVAILEKLESRSTRDVERILIIESTQPLAPARESLRMASATTAELKVYLDQSTIDDLKRLKEIWSHEMPNAKLSDIISKLARLGRERFDPMSNAHAHRRQTRGDKIRAAKPPCSKALERLHSMTSAPKAKSRYIPASIKREVWRRDLGRCTFTDLSTGRVCGSRYQLQFDHVKPFALGGDHNAENLRLRCFTHNQWHARQSFGSVTGSRQQIK